MTELQLPRRLESAARAMGFILVSVPLGVLGALTVLTLVLGAALSVIGIGLPLLLGAATLARWLAGLDRWAANRLLGTHLPPLAGRLPAHGGAWRRALRTLADRQLWRIVALFTVTPPLAAGTLVVGLVPVVLLAEIVSLGVQGLGGFGGVDFFGPWRLGVPVGLALCALAVPATVVAIAVLAGLHTVLCAIMRALLAPRAVPGGPVRELLAESLGDRSVSIAYWLPDRERFVDEGGHPVTLPDAGSGRAWTAVERDGRRVAAIVHDAALDTGPELVQAAATAAALAIDNERLKADLRARVEELRLSRSRIVEAGDEARRRLERDLHDGAQQQLVSLAIELRVLRARVGDPAAARLVDELLERLQGALGELRELARGIHPAILTDRGLGPALDLLADRARVPVARDVAIAGRLPASVEAAVYFVVAEALTNVDKYAQAGRAGVRIRAEGDGVGVIVEDDGVGGADVAAGSGLRGLADRVAALDGTLSLDSPPGGGTRLRVWLPCPGGVVVPAAPEPALAESA